jgi:hypothetical protein
MTIIPYYSVFFPIVDGLALLGYEFREGMIVQSLSDVFRRVQLAQIPRFRRGTGECDLYWT